MRYSPSGKYWFTVLAALQLTGVLAFLAAAQDDSSFKFIEITVNDPDGKPLSNVAIDIDTAGMQFPMPTNDQGKISLNIPSGADNRLELRVKHPEYAAASVSWQGGDAVPAKFTIPLEEGYPIGGIVSDENGKPIEGVKVEAATPTGTMFQGKVQTLLRGELATTDKDGKWRFLTSEKVPRKLRLKLSHPEYVSDTSPRVYATWEELKNLDHVMTLKKGITLRGNVTSSDGEPIAGAMILLGESRYSSNKQETETDAEGAYRIANVPAGSTIVTVAARRRAPEMRTVVAQQEMDPVDFELPRGKSIKILVTDVDGVPVAGADVAVEYWRGKQILPMEIYRGTTDDEGLWQCDSMPPEAVQFSVFKQGHLSSRNEKIAARDEPHKIVLPWALVVSGKVVDSITKVPVAKFKVVPGIDWGNGNRPPHWERYNVKQGSGGQYDMEFDEPRAGHYVRIEADGYRPAVSRMIKDDEGDVTIHFEMEVGTGPSGIVRTPDGKPAAGAELFVATPSDNLYFRNGREENNQRTPNTKSDEAGKYTLPFVEENFEVICLHDSGWTRRKPKQLEDSADIQLQGWSTVSGKVLEGDKPLADAKLRLYYNEGRYDPNAPRVYWDYQTTADAEGKFSFDRVQGDEATIARSIIFAVSEQRGFMSVYTHTVQVKLKPGQTTEIQIGGEGIAVKGQLQVPEDYEPEVIWNTGSVQLTEQPTQAANTGGFFRALGRAISGAPNRPAPQKPTFRRSYASAIDAEGGFRIADVLPGRYRINIQLYAERDGDSLNWQPIGRLHKVLTLPEPDQENPQEPVDLGKFTLEMTRP